MRPHRASATFRPDPEPSIHSRKGNLPARAGKALPPDRIHSHGAPHAGRASIHHCATMKTKRIKNITRYSYKNGHPFNGYRFAVSKNRQIHTKYFPDRK